MDDYVTLKKVAPLYRCFFESDGTYFDISTNLTSMEAALESIESGSTQKYKEYMDTASAFLEFGLPNVIEEKLNTTRLPSFLRACLSSFPLTSHHSMLSTFFQSEKLRAALSFQDLYIGLSPYEAPAIFSLLQALEFNEGIYYPIGGFQSIANALEQIAIDSGVRILYNSSVSGLKMSNMSGGIVEGVDIGHTNNEELNTMAPMTDTALSADFVVINQDLPQAEIDLIPPSAMENSATEKQPSCGVVSLSFGFSTRLTPLQHHNVFFSSDLYRSWDTVSSPDTSMFNSSSFNFYVHAPARTDCSTCPEGHDAITVLVPVPPLSRSPSNEIKYDISQVREAVLQRLQCIPSMPADLASFIVTETIRDPVRWKTEFGLFRGSAFGLSHPLSQLSFLRPRIRHPKLKNVYRVGASTRPGNGVPLVMIGAKIATEIILRAEGRNP